MHLGFTDKSPEKILLQVKSMLKVERINEKICVEAGSLINFFIATFLHDFSSNKIFQKVFHKRKCFREKKKGQLRNITFPVPLEKARKISLVPEIHLHKFSFVHPKVLFGKI